MNNTPSTAPENPEKQCRTCGKRFTCEYPALARYVEECGDCIEKRMKVETAESQRHAVADMEADQLRRWKRFCPEAHLETDVKRLPLPQLASRVLEWRSGPRGLLLHGDTRLGKSRCAWLLMKREFLAGRRVRVLDCAAGIDYAARFSESTAAAARWVDQACRTDLLLLDDVFKAKLTDSLESVLFAILDARDQAMLPIIVTTNDAPESLAPRLTSDRRAPLLRRLREMTQPMAFIP